MLRTVSAVRRRRAEVRQRIDQRPEHLEALNAELRARHLQQAAVAALGQHAIRDRDLATLLDEAAAVTAETLERTAGWERGELPETYPSTL